ncbi:MAG: hypothetical protein Q8M31_23540 [Beijerinckiaceae bacterium]|nr:hypothetical protein [Beijerinckiaceae bacterium]
MIISFPKQAKQPTSAESKRTAGVHAFPSARRGRMVANICAEMRARAEQAASTRLDAAEAALIDHLEIVWSHLEAVGVSEAEREDEIRTFAIAAWRAFEQNSIASSPEVA